jgi:hypothetical protein
VHFTLWRFTGAFNFSDSQQVDWNGVQLGSWVLSDGSAQYTGCMTPVAGGQAQCPTVSIYNDGTVPSPLKAWHLRTDNSTGDPNIVFAYGLPGDVPVVGDWCGIGLKGPGVYRSGTFYLRCRASDGPTDFVFPFGIAGDVPVAGDWTGKGFDTVGVFRSGSWYLRNSHTPDGGTDISFAFGLAGDSPIVGDWTGRVSPLGNFIDTVGVVRNGTWYLTNRLAPPADIVFDFGLAGDAVTAGDWTGQGKSTPGIFRNGQWYLKNSNGPGSDVTVFSYGITGDTPVVGYWTGRTNPVTGFFIHTVGIVR